MANQFTGIMTSKGRMTIPVPVRVARAFARGDRVEFVEFDSGQFTLIAVNDSVRTLKGLFRKPGKTCLPK